MKTGLKKRLNPYFIGLPILISERLNHTRGFIRQVSILILLDYLFLCFEDKRVKDSDKLGLNPYFIGLPILIPNPEGPKEKEEKSQSLFYWITYSYNIRKACEETNTRLNPYFIGLPILIIKQKKDEDIVILSQSLFYWITYSYESLFRECGFNYNTSQSLFYWITYSYYSHFFPCSLSDHQSQSLFYWITYSYIHILI